MIGRLDGLVSALTATIACSPGVRALSVGEEAGLWARTLALESRLGQRYGGRSDIGYRPFVRDLIGSTFLGLQNASRAQVRAYQELLTAAHLAKDEDARVLTSLVLLGLQRVTVTDGSVDARMRFLIEQLASTSDRTPRIAVTDAEHSRLHETGRVRVRFHTETLSPLRFTERADWRKLELP